jgi:uncharacterized protein (TIGR00730 family)
MDEFRERRRYSTRNDALDEAVDSLMALCSQPRDDDYLVREMIITALKMKIEDCDTLALKMTSAALKEMRYSFKVFGDYKDFKKVSVFGSARTDEKAPEYALARDFAHKMAGLGFMVITGAGGGIMQAANEGAGADMSFGLNIRLPFEQKANRFIDNDRKLIAYKYFFTRKLMFVKEADALVLFPGGFGTLNECMELLALIQTGKCHPMPIVMLDVPGGTFWESYIEYLKTSVMSHSYISAADMGFMHLSHDIDDACTRILDFYKNYHSLRVVGKRMVIRLKIKPKDGFIESLTKRFSDIVVNGGFEISDRLKEEEEEHHIIHLPRLVFNFDGKSFGRLRALIDAMAEAEGEPVHVPDAAVRKC